MICKECSKVFNPIRGSKRKFCSLICANLWQKKSPYPGPKKSKILVQCKRCSKEMELIPSLVGKKIFCSIKCQYKWRSELHSGSKNPNWKGGMDRNDYPYEWSEARLKILQRDGSECVNPACNQKTTKVNVHHIDYDKHNLDLENLICLCASCNARANFHRIFWKAYYKNYMSYRKTINYSFPYARGDIVIDLSRQSQLVKP